MAKGVLDEVRESKLPAIEQEGRLKVANDGPEVLLFARSGFSDELQVAAQGRADRPR